MALFRKAISMDELAAKQNDTTRATHGRAYSAETGGWTEPVAEPKTTTEAGATDKDASGARKWWQ
ncbi:hypothetical protein ACODT4_39920 [Streptomyces sp. 2.9]|uniref:hypothetical protein n=1 Tax=Streptomyces tritrimontium TaxID=3406573 RepID=UPI003BB80C0E